MGIYFKFWMGIQYKGIWIDGKMLGIPWPSKWVSLVHLVHCIVEVGQVGIRIYGCPQYFTFCCLINVTIVLSKKSLHLLYTPGIVLWYYMWLTGLQCAAWWRVLIDFTHRLGMMWGFISTRELLGVHWGRCVITSSRYSVLSWYGCYRYVDTALFGTNRRSLVALITK